MLKVLQKHCVWYKLKKGKKKILRNSPNSSLSQENLHWAGVIPPSCIFCSALLSEWDSCLEISQFPPSANTNILHTKMLVPAKALPKVEPLQDRVSCVHFRKRINQPSQSLSFQPRECESLLSLLVCVPLQEPVPCCQPSAGTMLPVIYMDQLDSVVISSVQLPGSCSCAHGGGGQQWGVTHPARDACEPPGVHTKQSHYTVYETMQLTILFFCLW